MRARVRSTLLTAGLVLFAIAGWLYFAPAQIGGSTTYVITSGISMEPRFHSGDLALVRPASVYRVGEVVAYRSSLLHVTVLHRIIAIRNGHYVFKGDNNNFIDPVRPTRSDLVGTLWWHIPHGGVVLKLIHTPLFVAILIAVVGLLCVIGEQERRRRRRRRRGAGESLQRDWALQLPSELRGPVDLRPWLAGAGVAAALFMVLGLFAFGTATSRPASTKVPFTQHMRFGYGASVRPGPVYPDGRVHTGQPIFLHLVHRIELTSDYRLTTPAAHRLSGTEQLALGVSSPTGWRREFPLGRPMRFAGVRLRAVTVLDVSSVQALLARVQALTGVAADSGSSIELIANIHITGTLAGSPLNSSFAPSFSLQLQPLQLQPGSAPAGLGSPPGAGGLDQAKVGSVALPGSKPGRLHLFGASVGVAAARSFALLGTLLALAALIALAVLARLRAPFEETVRIQARYGHLIVPIVTTPETLAGAPFDVTSIEALARLAESSQRLILHHRDPVGDTYLVSDDTGLYRYRAGGQRVVWGEWQPPRPPAGYPAPASDLPDAPVAAATVLPVAPRPSFLEDVAPTAPGDTAVAQAVSQVVSQPVADPPSPGGVPLSAYLGALPPATPTRQPLARVSLRLMREVVRGARRGQPPRPTA